MPSTSRRPQQKSQDKAALDPDLSVGRLVLERSQSDTKTAEEIKQEELLRRAARKRNNYDYPGAVPAPAVARRPVANTRKKALNAVTAKTGGTNNTKAHPRNNDNLRAVPAPAVVRRPYAKTMKKALTAVTTKVVGTNNTKAHLQPKSQEEADNEPDLSLGQFVLERSQTATMTAENIKQEELLRRSTEKKNSNDNLGAVPAPAVVRRPAAKTRKAVGADNTKAHTQPKSQEGAALDPDLSVGRLVLERSQTATKTAEEIKQEGLLRGATEIPNDFDYSDAAGDATPNPVWNPATGTECDPQTGCPITKHSLPPGSDTPGAYTGVPGANYQAVEQVRLDVLRASYEPRPHLPAQVEEAEFNTTETLEEKIRIPVLIGVAIAVLAVVITLAVAIPLAGGENGESPKMENYQELDMTLLPNAPDSTWESIMMDQESAQYKAYTWLTRDPNLQTYENWQKEQRFVLATFYYACDGPKWRFKDPQAQNEWLSYETSECGWGVFNKGPLLNGVRCSTGDRVTEIKVMEQRGFKGSVPLELSLLGSLKVLDLSKNIMANHLPDLLPIHESEPFQSLEVFHCINCRLVGSLPPELFAWANLESLDLSNNQISGPLPVEIGSMTALAELSLCDTQLSGTVPSEIGLLTSLTSLWLHTNHFSGSLPTEIGMLSSVKALQLRGNQLSGTIPSELGLLTMLARLSLYDNRFSGSIPTSSCSNSGLRIFLDCYPDPFAVECPCGASTCSCQKIY
ncbi:Leucine Rich Repeat [Seminavis robusta]|uniref:Leucine Rich Repeat n=1 Tax=Seminavis robusta TaxID=568900 RepID=A0A9N8HLQ3_9STRA|nr:Leucine Rich Repeat [Seminavis robusta]|eukprot:Sro842_g209690.1 Leucine Rich Repeat (742) ;mRNA; f:20019-22244